MTSVVEVVEWPDLTADLPPGYYGQWSSRRNRGEQDFFLRLDVWGSSGECDTAYIGHFDGANQDDCYEEFSDWLAGQLGSQPVT